MQMQQVTLICHLSAQNLVYQARRLPVGPTRMTGRDFFGSRREYIQSLLPQSLRHSSTAKSTQSSGDQATVRSRLTAFNATDQEVDYEEKNRCYQDRLTMQGEEVQKGIRTVRIGLTAKDLFLERRHLTLEFQISKILKH